VRGPCRLRAAGWLLIGATPLIWCVSFLLQSYIDRNAHRPYLKNAPAQVAFNWASWILDMDARWRYPRWTYGRHVVLIDDGQTPSPEKLVAEMDKHIQAMAGLLGQPVPNVKFPWIRGSLLGPSGANVTLNIWAICGEIPNASELTVNDRHEVAHALIRELSGPDQDPPGLLIEGWAMSQESPNHDNLLGDLAKRRKDGETFSLQTLVGPELYDRSNGWSYCEGGPLVIYLMGHYGPETFFRLYSKARCDSFQKDCQEILGDSWEAVEAGFWRWFDAQAKPPVEAQVKTPDPSPAVHLAKSVDPADWQALVEGYRKTNKVFRQLPTNAAFVCESDDDVKSIDTPGPAKRAKYEFRAVFEGERFWIFDNNNYRADCFLMGTPVRNAELLRFDADSLESQMRQKAREILSQYQSQCNSAQFLPLPEKPWNWNSAACRIERVVRPTQGKAGKWKVEFAVYSAKSEPEERCQIELDPAHCWWMTRVVREGPGKQRYELDAEYEHFGDALMPTSLQMQFADEHWDQTYQGRARPMSESERQDLKRRVVRSAVLGVDYFGWRRRLLPVIVIGCPLIGLALLGIGRWRESRHGIP
ncbi:MAG: hypothetical protein ABSG53_02135, partial [Thermoguttaceae bacterium]